MATKEEIKIKILPKLFAKLLREMTYTDFDNALSGSDAATKLLIRDGIVKGQSKLIGNIIIKLVKQEIRDKANIVADTLLADDSLDLNELDQIL